jgi:hypothetical protein
VCAEERTEVVIEIGKKYADGWGAEHTVGGVVKVNPEWVWTIQGNWYRQADGRRVMYVLIDATRHDGPRRHIPAAKPSSWDLRCD